MPTPRCDRRAILAAAGGFAAAAACGRLTWAAAPPLLPPTPRQTAGPFYPQTKPADADADLATVAGADGTATGTILLVEGRVMAPDGRPVADALVEIWQCDAYGRYHHPYDGGGGDPRFQGYGAIRTTADGAYRFRTIRPVAYPGRAPHIHFAISGPRFAPLTTQMYVAGEPLNDRDLILGRITDPARRASLIVPLRPAAPNEPAILAGTFDIVLGEGPG
jgi:protocatechuate 3,4-dioxygenase beta subunit